MDKVLLHAVRTLNQLNYEFDVFVWRDATTPFINSEHVKNAIKLLQNKLK